MSAQEPSALIGRSAVLPGNGRTDLSWTNIGVVQPLATGLVSLHTVPGQQFEILQRIVFTWKTSAVVGVRTLGVLFRDSSGNLIATALASGQQSEGTTADYTFDLDATAANVPNVFYTSTLPYMVMQPTQQWLLFGIGLDPGDQQDGLTHTELVIPTGPTLVSAPPAPLVTPVLV